MRHYSRDPYWTAARFDSHCAGCKAEIRKGQRIFYYPNGKQAMGSQCGCAETAAGDFDAACFDERQYSS